MFNVPQSSHCHVVLADGSAIATIMTRLDSTTRTQIAVDKDQLLRDVQHLGELITQQDSLRAQSLASPSSSPSPPGLMSPAQLVAVQGRLRALMQKLRSLQHDLAIMLGPGAVSSSSSTTTESASHLHG